jgi:hypothetical protein
VVVEADLDGTVVVAELVVIEHLLAQAAVVQALNQRYLL